MNLLEIENLKKSYVRGFIPKRTQVLKGLSFSVPSGSITGFLGANGAGKTTTMRCLLGLDFPDSGRIHFFGKPLDADGRRRIGFLPERPYFYEHLSGIEFLEFYAQLSQKWKRGALRDRVNALLKRVDLDHAKTRALRTYSKGMLQKIGLAQALVHEPELVILDEPVSGLDPDGRLALSELILETARGGQSVFFTSHLLHDTERLCQRLVVLKDGRCIYEGTTEALLDQGGVEIEIDYVENGSLKSLKVPDQNNLQKQIADLLASGKQINQIRRARSTLEEIFVRMAMRRGD